MTTINSKRWFEYVTGIPESQWNFDLNSLPKKINTGSFQQLSINELLKLANIDELNDLSLISNFEAPILNIIVRENWNNAELFDTSAQQVKAEKLKINKYI